MATGSQPDSVFYGAYDKYVGEARTKPQVYGYWVLVVGLLAVLVGVLVFLVGNAVSLGVSAVRLREVSVALGAAGGVSLLLGSVLQLPLRRRAVYVAVLGAVLALGATGLFVRINPERWGFGTSTASVAVLVGYVGGLSVVALVAALVPVVTGRQALLLGEEPADELAWVVEEDDERRDVSEVLLGESTRDGVFAVFPSDGGWCWRFVEQAAVADSTVDYETQGEAETALDTVRERVAAAGLLEVNHAAFRLYRDSDDGTESFQWALVDEDGVVLADSRTTYADRKKAERSVNMLKEHGPGAALLDVGDGAFEVFGEGEEWSWRLVDADRTPLGQSPRAFDERPDAEASVDETRELLADAPLMDVEHVGFELIEDDGDWHWELKDSADTTVARSSDGFRTRREVENSVKRLAEGAIDMPFLDATTPGYEVVEGAGGGWRWRLVDGTDEVVARCEGAVPSAESGRKVVSRVKRVVADADVLELPDAEFEVYRDGDEWAWRLVTEDRRVVARSPNGDTFIEPGEAMAVVEHLQTELETAERIEFDSAAFHIYEAEDGGWNWRLVDSDGSLISDSAKQHASREDAAATMNTMKEHAPDAELVEIETSTLELYEADEEWHWRLVDAAGETLATSPGRHETADDAHDAMDTLELLAPDAESRTMNAAIFQVYVSDSEPRQWRWRLIHPDGSVISTSADTFPDREQAQSAAEVVSGFADEATVHTISDLAVRFTVDVDEPSEDSEREEPVERWHWHVVDRNRDEVAMGTERFPSRDAVAATARLVRDHAGAATVFEVDPAAIRLDENDAGWFWRLIDRHRETLAVGARAHENREDARADLSRVRELAVGTELLDFDLAAFEVVDRDSGWAWQFVDTAGTVIGASPTYNSRQAAERALAEVRDQLRQASLLEIESPAFELHGDEGEWRWRLVDTDGATVAEGMRAYQTRREAREALESLRAFGGEAAIEVAG